MLRNFHRIRKVRQHVTAKDSFNTLGSPPTLPIMFKHTFRHKTITSIISQAIRLNSSPRIRCLKQFSRMASTLPRLPVFEAIATHNPNSIAVIHSLSGRKFTYGELLGDVAEAKDRLYAEAGSKSLEGQRIAFLVENSYDYVGAQQTSSR